jgi:predicted dehydrogenase
MSLKPVKTAIIGSGNISYTYMNTLTSGFSIIELVGCSDLIPEKSKARSELFGIKQMTTEEILADPEIEIVLNLTEIKNHSKVTKMILEAGKHAYSEKSAGCAIDETQANLDLAKAKGLRFGSAPDTYMGAACQTARKLIDDGWIGHPIGARGWCIRTRRAGQRPDTPDPEGNYVRKGTTITYDMSGYYNNALVSLLGPVARCSGFAKAFDKHIWENTKHPDFGKPITVGSGANTIMAVYEFANGCYGSFFITSESFGREIPLLEIFGTKGFLQVPDPNNFGGWGKDLYISRIGDDELRRVPFTHGFADTDPSVQPKSGKREPCHNSWRGIAVVDMAYAIRRGRPHRSSPELAMHNVEIISAIEENSQTNPGVYVLKSQPEKPAPLTPGFIGPPEVMEGAIDNI